MESVTPEIMPPSYRIVPSDPDADNVTELARQFSEQPGVKEVATATEAIRQIEDFSTRVSQALLLAAIVLVAVSAVLILNTVFTAISARKTEIEVMKLVGASKVLAYFQESEAVPLFRGFAVPDGFVWNTSIWILVIGAAIGMIGSAFAVTRYLDV